jgi:hypothetical protein
VGCEHDGTALVVAESDQADRDTAEWSAHYRFDDGGEWRQCSVLDISLDCAEIELRDARPEEGAAGPLFLQIDSVAEDDVGVIVGAEIRQRDAQDDGRVIVGVEFSARREERMLLHLLVRLHAYA